MPNVCNLTGKKFGKLYVIKKVGINKAGRALWECLCDCGNTCIKHSQYIQTGRAVSCGCWARQIERDANLIHGFNNTRLYSIFRGMYKRCYIKSNRAYKHYGGRGITICDDWLNDRSKFFLWAISNGYSDNLTIQRVDNYKGYSPDNCTWVTNKEQQNNKRTNYNVTYKGITHTVAEWEDILGMNRNTLRSRLSKYHWSIDKAIETSVKHYNWKYNK